MKRLVAMIVAMSPERAIGLEGRIPWRHPGDLKRFKRLTTGATVIMGRNTWTSIGRPLPNRRNIVITSRDIPGVECFRDIPSALAASEGDVWFIGGARIYEQAMKYVDLIDVTYVLEHVDDPRAVRFPEIDLAVFEPGPREPHEDEPGLERQTFRRRSTA